MRAIQTIKGLVSRGIVGLFVGLAVGAISGLIVGSLMSIVTNDASARVVGSAVFWAGLGAPLVGMFVAWSANFADYHSGTSIEWGITGAAIALLLAWLEKVDFATAIVLIVMYAITAVLVYDSVSILFGDESQTDHVTLKSILLYSSNVLVTTFVIFKVFSFIESLID